MVFRKLIELIRRKRRYGGIDLIAPNGIRLKAKRRVSYTLTGGHNNIHLDDYEDLKALCQKQGIRLWYGDKF